LEQYRRACVLQEAHTAFTRLRKNKKAWREELAERAAWEGTLSDGIA